MRFPVALSPGVCPYAVVYWLRPHGGLCATPHFFASLYPILVGFQLRAEWKECHLYYWASNSLSSGCKVKGSPHRWRRNLRQQIMGSLSV